MRCSARSFVLPVFALVAVLAVGCGGGGSGSSATPTAPTPTPTANPQPAPSQPSANVLGTWQGNMAIQIHNIRYNGPVELRILQQQAQSVEGHLRCIGDCGRGIGTGVNFRGTVSGSNVEFSFNVPGEDAGTTRWDFDLVASDNTLTGRVHRYWISGIGSDDWGNIGLSTGGAPPPDLPPPPGPTTTIGGRVSAVSTGQLLSGASIEVLGTNIRATTDAAGMYRLEGIGSITFTVRYSHPSYQTLEREYTFMRGTERLDLEARLTPKS